mmetsp:Transcript_15425/g.44164  ORF Transcript_15425/g.44164 Transcript_15425/m.44164 type:complete len:244 (+) Transcript_15425:329-1060(+)
MLSRPTSSGQSLWRHYLALACRLQAMRWCPESWSIAASTMGTVCSPSAHHQQYPSERSVPVNPPGCPGCSDSHIFPYRWTHVHTARKPCRVRPGHLEQPWPCGFHQPHRQAALKADALSGARVRVLALQLCCLVPEPPEGSHPNPSRPPFHLKPLVLHLHTCPLGCLGQPQLHPALHPGYQAFPRSHVVHLWCHVPEIRRLSQLQHAEPDGDLAVGRPWVPWLSRRRLEACKRLRAAKVLRLL